VLVRTIKSQRLTGIGIELAPRASIGQLHATLPGARGGRVHALADHVGPPLMDSRRWLADYGDPLCGQSAGATDPRRLQRFMVFSRHIAAGACRCSGGKIPSTTEAHRAVALS